MKRKISEQAYYDRLKELAEVKKTSTNENKGGNLGTLIDYKRSSDGVAFGIVKENHKYYIKKGGLKENLDVSDFVYISGLGNIKQYQYNSLAEADKNRNMLLNTINETTSLKFNEDKISDEIEQAEKKLDDANVAANEPIEEPTDDENIDEPLDDENIEEPSDDEPLDDENIEEPSDDENIEEPSDDEPLDDENIEEPSDDESLDDENIEEPTGDEDDKKDSIKSDIGKIGNKIQQTSLTDSQVKSYVNMFLGYFKEYFLKMEQSLLNDMAKKINALQKEKNIDDLQKDVISEPTQDIENITENNLNNSGFINYAESMGYDKDSLLECNVEEMSNLISGYANSCEDGEYDDDHKTVALFLKLMPKVIDVLKNEYGCDEYINKLEPEMKSLEDTSDVELQEALGGAIWGGLKTIGKGITDPIKDKAKKVGTAINKGIENVKQGAAAQSRKQDIRRGTKKRNAYLDKVQEKAKELIELIQQANAGAAKAGQEPIKVAGLLSTIRNQISSKNSYVDLSQYKMENSSEMTNTEVLPDLEPEMKSLEDTSDVELQEALGGAIWGGLKTIGKGITDPIKDKAKKVGTAINKGIENVKQGAAAQSRKQDIRRGTKKRNAYLDKVQEKAKELIELIQQANAGAAKAGQEPIKVAGLLSTIRNQISSKNSYVDLSQYKMENSSEMTNTEVLPDVDNKISESEKKLRNYIRKRLEEISGLRKVSINESKKSSKLKKLDKLIESQYNFYKKKITVDNKISESEKFLRNYIRKRLEEISGLRKVNINESKKSSKLKKLDKLIESQYNLYLDLKKKNIEENYNIDEIFGKSKKEIFYKLDPNDENAILDFFKKVFSEEFNTPYSGAFKNALNLTPREKRYNILKQYFDNNQKGTIARNNQTGELVYTLKSPLIKGNSLSGKGFNAGY